MTEPKTSDKVSILDRLAKLTEQSEKLAAERNALLDGAKTELLNKGQAIIDELAALGFEYHFTPIKSAGSKERTGKVDPTKPCPICHFSTLPTNHDARAHRSQVKKAPFNEEDLKRLGLSRID
jgi:hypothetical protein